VRTRLCAQAEEQYLPLPVIMALVSVMKVPHAEQRTITADPERLPVVSRRGAEVGRDGVISFLTNLRMNQAIRL
jgi:hypothetical protein